MNIITLNEHLMIQLENEWQKMIYCLQNSHPGWRSTTQYGLHIRGFQGELVSKMLQKTSIDDGKYHRGNVAQNILRDDFTINHHERKFRVASTKAGVQMNTQNIEMWEADTVVSQKWLNFHLTVHPADKCEKGSRRKDKEIIAGEDVIRNNNILIL